MKHATVLASFLTVYVVSVSLADSTVESGVQSPAAEDVSNLLQQSQQVGFKSLQYDYSLSHPGRIELDPMIKEKNIFLVQYLKKLR